MLCFRRNLAMSCVVWSASCCWADFVAFWAIWAFAVLNPVVSITQFCLYRFCLPWRFLVRCTLQKRRWVRCVRNRCSPRFVARSSLSCAVANWFIGTLYDLDKQALMEVYIFTNGANWFNKANWKRGQRSRFPACAPSC